MQDWTLRFLRHRGGATAIEYALIASLVSIAIISSLTALSSSVGEVWASVAAAFGPQA